jgi:hypothetical protein
VCEGLVFRVRADDDHVADVLATQLDAFTPSDDEPSVVYDIRRPTDDRSRHLWTLTVHRDGSSDTTEVHAPTGPGMVDALVDRLDHDVLDASPDRLHLHAALVARDGRAVIAVGPSHAGKSTLSATLADNGYRYLTDEMVSVADDGGRLALAWVPKPIGLRPDAVERMGVTIDDHGTASVRGLHVALVAPAPAVTDDALDGLEPGLLVTLARADGAPASLEAMHPSDLTVAVLESSFDAVRLGAHALTLAARLAAASRGGRLVYGEAADAVAVVDDARLAGTRDLAEVRTIEPEPDRPSGNGPARSRHTASVWVGDQAVVLHLPTRRVVALDPAHSTVWALLDGATPVATLAGELARDASGDADLVTTRLADAIDDLVAHGLVT